MQRPELTDGDEQPEASANGSAPLSMFEQLTRMIERNAFHIVGTPIHAGNNREAFHNAVRRALQAEGFDFTFSDNGTDEPPIPDTVRMHSAFEIHNPGTLGRILSSGEFVDTLRREFMIAGVLPTPEERVVASGSGAFEVLDGAPATPSVEAVEKPAA